jgi:hypothetical protein
MNQDLDLLRQAKDNSGAEIASQIRDLTPRYFNQIPALREVLDKGNLFRMGGGEPYDSAAIQTALLSIVLSNVSLYDPYLKKQQTQAIQEACATLGLSYNEVLDLTAKEDRVIAALVT